MFFSPSLCFVVDPFIDRMPSAHRKGERQKYTLHEPRVRLRRIATDNRGENGGLLMRPHITQAIQGGEWWKRVVGKRKRGGGQRRDSHIRGASESSDSYREGPYMCRQGPGAAPCLRLDSPLQSCQDRPRSERRENIIRKEAGRKEEGQWRGSPGNIKGSKNGGGEGTESGQENAKEKCTYVPFASLASLSPEREREEGRKGKRRKRTCFSFPHPLHFPLLPPHLSVPFCASLPSHQLSTTPANTTIQFPSLKNSELYVL